MDITLTHVASKRISEEWEIRSTKHYVRLSQPVDPDTLSEDDWYELLDMACELLGLWVKTYCAPGQYFASVPSLRIRGQRMIVYQYAGYDV
jgi:hypothetical protein